MPPVAKPTGPRHDTPAGGGVDRRGFLTSLTTAAAAGVFGGAGFGTAFRASAAPSPKSTAETAVKALYDVLTDAQKKTVCFDWDYKHPKRGLLRTHVSNFWHITKPMLVSDFYTKDQQALFFQRTFSVWMAVGFVVPYFCLVPSPHGRGVR